MKTILYIGIIMITFFSACGQEVKKTKTECQRMPTIEHRKQEKKFEKIEPRGQTLQTRIFPPAGYQRTKLHDGSFAEYLRQLPLKPHNSQVELFNGSIKPNYDIYDAVVDLDIGNKDLHQCADAVMRLRAEYLWKQNQFDKIHFNFTNGFRVDYSEWMKGKRIIVEGNSTRWTQATNPSNTYRDFWKYMEIIFSYAGTLSLSKELKQVDIHGMKIGDVFIQGGTPGHAIMVVDMAEDPTSGKKIFLLAQSYMPAQQIQILKNPNDKIISPWYSIDFGQELVTPEWKFNKTDLKRFEE